MTVELNREEIGVLVDVLRFALEQCPVEAASDDFDVTTAQVDALTQKLEGALAP